ncbi:MAG: adenylate/guanylate cyclase domain-containing protein [Clostridiales bacterium]|nr:adenylate/guanylate cyclase domain-containing protein [Clostridiales bacterium]
MVDYNLITFLYFVLIGLFLSFLVISIIYLFNRKVLSKLNISIKLSFYIAVYSLVLISLVYYLFGNTIFYDEGFNFIVLTIIFVIYILACFFTFYINLYPLKKIARNTKNLSKGGKNNLVILGSKEFDQIQNNLNEIEQKHITQEEYKLKIKKEYYKFVPREFYDYLGKDEVFDLKLGENVQKEVTVLFIDIRHSYKTSETLSLDDNFRFINSYLSVVGECVRNNNGFIDKFLGDGVLAVFLNEVDAINCSSDISNKFENMNIVSIGQDKIKFGIGLHSGKVVIGIVGEKERLTPTIISDSVNLANKIESLNKIFLSKILFTKEVLNNLPSSFELNYRYVGTVNIDDCGVSLFENLDGYTGSNKTAFIKTKNIFETAVRHFENKEYENARNLFIKVIEENEDDNLAKYYLKKCKLKI